MLEVSLTSNPLYNTTEDGRERTQYLQDSDFAESDIEKCLSSQNLLFNSYKKDNGLNILNNNASYRSGPPESLEDVRQTVEETSADSDIEWNVNVPNLLLGAILAAGVGVATAGTSGAFAASVGTYAVPAVFSVLSSRNVEEKEERDQTDEVGNLPSYGVKIPHGNRERLVSGYAEFIVRTPPNVSPTILLNERYGMKDKGYTPNANCFQYVHMNPLPDEDETNVDLANYNPVSSIDRGVSNGGEYTGAFSNERNTGTEGFLDTS